MKKRHYTFQEILQMDKALHQLAAYDVTKGRIVSVDDEDQNEAIYKKIVAKFNYFKQSIQAGEYTLEELRDHILHKYGPFVQKKMTLDEDLMNIMNSPSLDNAPEEGDLEKDLGVFADNSNEKLDHVAENLFNMLMNDKKNRIEPDGPVCVEELEPPSPGSPFKLFKITAPQDMVDKLLPKVPSTTTTTTTLPSNDVLKKSKKAIVKKPRRKTNGKNKKRTTDN